MLCDRDSFAQISCCVSVFSEQSGHAVLFFTGNLPFCFRPVRGCLWICGGGRTAGAGLALRQIRRFPGGFPKREPADHVRPCVSRTKIAEEKGLPCGNADRFRTIRPPRAACAVYPVRQPVYRRKVCSGAMKNPMEITQGGNAFAEG